MKELTYTIWLSLACTPGSKNFAKLLEKFSTPRDIYEADAETIAAIVGSRSRDYKSLIDKSTDRAEKIYDFCMRKGVGILTYFDKEYPTQLKEIKNPPVLLYYRGKLLDFDREFGVSVVGTRRISPYGRKNTFSIAHDLARAGAVIVSGMAEGVDGVAHAGALSADRPTVAVIGSGIDVCYPPEHRTLAREIVKRGCVMTEYAPGTKPLRHNFPARNRIVSALSRVTLVMEGSERSGSLITARCAAEQNKPVYAFPGNVGNEGSAASNILIRNGARLFTSADDIIRDFEKTSLGKLNPFRLSDGARYDMNLTLSELKVSCVSAEDGIFRARKSVSAPTARREAAHKADNRRDDTAMLSGLDKATLAVYKKIPVNSDCAVDSLVDEKQNLRVVMTALLTLELMELITMLPGDRVKRNL